jgi:hypothetical protein
MPNFPLPNFPQAEPSLRETIQTYESMLEVFPEDISAMEALLGAYKQAGEEGKLCQVAHTLLPLLTSGGDWRRVQEVAQAVAEVVPEDEVCRKALAEAALILGTTPAPAAAEGEAAAAAEVAAEGGGEPEAVPFPGGRRPPTQELAFDIRCELDLAYHLLTHEAIRQAHYETAIDLLTESSLSATGESPLCLLQELREIDRVDIGRIVDFLAAEGGLPYIEISHCECQMKAVRLLPLRQAKRLGILPFDQVGDELMVVLLNPVSKELRDRLSRQFGGRLHFFFTSPDEFTAVVNRLMESAAKEKPALA